MIFFGHRVPLNREHKQAYYLQMYSMLMLFVALNYEILLGKETFNFFFLLKLFVLAFIYNFHFRTFYKLDLYFWVFSFLIVCYQLWGFIVAVVGTHSYSLFYMYLTSNIALWLELYIMSSPIFFPRTLWWEYDVRYRSDLKIGVELHNASQVESFTGRMTDIRRSAACVVLFQDIPLKKKIFIKTNHDNRSMELPAVVLSKREYSFGRGITYGVKFLLKTNEEKKLFKNFSIEWAAHRNKKLEIKLIDLKNNERSN